ncbi:TolC family protein, partial [uncultured Sphingomonas sp.]|uniref:TolC family protein n=1 Tax=uncultured Sphingomonas sp. TaxID=158754 RepID=UPI00262513F7
MRGVTMMALLAGGALAGCTPPDVRPAVNAKAPADLGLAGASAPAVDARWWRALGDAQLDRIVADALAGNPTLDAAAARVRQAQAALASRRAEDGPNVAFDANGTAQRLSGTYIYPPPYGGTVRFLGTAQAGLEWNLDLFGRQKAAIAGARASAQAAALDAAAARLMLQGAIVSTYLEVVRAERQAALAGRTIAARTQSLKLIDVRIRSHLASRLDREAANTLLAQAELALARAHAARALAANALAALAGR